MSGANVVEIVVTADNQTAAGMDEVKAQADEVAASYDEVGESADRAAEAQDGQAAASGRSADAQDGAKASAAELAAANDEAAGSYERAAAAADVYTDAQGRLRDSNGRFVASEQAVGDSSEEAAAKTDASSDSAGFMAGAWGKAKLALLGAAGAMVYGTVKAAGFQSVMTTLNTQAGVSRSQLASLGSGVLSLAGQVGFSPDSLAGALYHVESSFASVGITGPKALNLLKTAAEGAAVGHADLTDTTNALDATIVAGVPGIHSYAGAMGALNAIVGSGDMTMQDLAEAMGTGVMAVAKSYGQSIYQVGAALAVFGDNNIRGAKAATDLRMAWQAMQAPLVTAKPVLAGIGLTMTELGHTMTHQGMTAAIGQFIQHLNASKVPVADWGQYMTEIFGKKAGVGISILVDQLARLKSKFPDLEHGASGFGAAWEHTNQTVGQQWNELKSSLTALVTKMGEGLLPMAMRAVHGLTDFANALEQGKGPALAIAGVIGSVLAGIALNKLQHGLESAKEGFEGLFQGGEKVVGWASDLIGKFSGTGAAAADAATETGELTAATEEQTAATEEFAAAQGEADAAMDANPIGALIMLLVGLAAVVYEVVKHWKDFEHWGSEALHFVEAAARDVFNWIKANWPLLLAILLGPIAVAALEIAKHWDDIKDAASDAMHGIEDVVRDTVSWVESHWQILLAIMTAGVSAAAMEIISHWHDIESGAVTAVTAVVHWFERLPGMILSAVGDLGQLLWSAGQQVLEGLLGGIESMVGSVVHAAASVGSDILSGIKGALGLGSPSRITFQYARDLWQGHINGSESMRGALAAQAASMARAALPGGGSAFGGGFGAYGAGGGGGWIEAKLVGGNTSDPLMREIIAGLKLYVRTAGGGGPNSAQRALGQGT